jgi:hypothetical protein
MALLKAHTPYSAKPYPGLPPRAAREERNPHHTRSSPGVAGSRLDSSPRLLPFSNCTSWSRCAPNSALTSSLRPTGLCLSSPTSGRHRSLLSSTRPHLGSDHVSPGEAGTPAFGVRSPVASRIQSTMLPSPLHRQMNLIQLTQLPPASPASLPFSGCRHLVSHGLAWHAGCGGLNEAARSKNQPLRPCLGRWPGMKPSSAWPGQNGMP